MESRVWKIVLLTRICNSSINFAMLLLNLESETSKGCETFTASQCSNLKRKRKVGAFGCDANNRVLEGTILAVI